LTCERVREAVGNILAASLNAAFFCLHVPTRKNDAKERVRSKRLLGFFSLLLDATNYFTNNHFVIMITQF
jgi:hypothetical protein